MFDVIIVGGGPAGLSAALMLGRCRRSVLLCDLGQPRNRRSQGLHGYLTRDGIAPVKLNALGRDELKTYGVEVFVTDPAAEADEAMHEYGVRLHAFDALPRADAIVAAVAHREYKALGAQALAAKVVPGGAFIDVKAAFSSDNLRAAGLKVWRL